MANSCNGGMIGPLCGRKQSGSGAVSYTHLDEEDILIDFVNFPDLLLSADGVRECRDILENYVTEDIVADAFEALCHEEAIRAEISILAARLREMGAVNLIKLYVKCGDKQIRQFVAAEAYHRFFLSGILRKLRSLFYSCLLYTSRCV